MLLSRQQPIPTLNLESREEKGVALEEPTFPACLPLLQPALPIVPSRTWTHVSLHGAEGERASVLLVAQKRAGASWLCASRALRQQCATAHVAGSKRAAAGVVGALWRGGGWRRWSHEAEERRAWRWRRLCEAAVRARCGQGRGWCVPCWAR